MDSIARWRPRFFADIVGAANARTVSRLQKRARERLSFTGLFLGPYGSAKTSMARLLLQSYQCQQPNMTTADPCGKCNHCLAATPEHSGESLYYQFWEIDCTQSINRKSISDTLEQARKGIWPPFLVLDELQRLHEHSAQEALLKFVEDLKEGVLIACVMTDTDRLHDRPIAVLPALFDRLAKYRFEPAEPDAIEALLQAQLPNWGITAEEGGLNELVRRSCGSFRSCLSVLEEARITNSSRLDSDLIDESLPPVAATAGQWLSPFSDNDL